MNEILKNVIGTILGGLALTLILFVINEYLFKKRNITGHWEMEMETDTSTLPRYVGLKVEYQINIIQKGFEIKGFGEKILEIRPDGTQYTFEHEKRVTIDIDGYFEKNYLSNSKIYMNVFEYGRKRKTSATIVYTLPFFYLNRLLVSGIKGEFSTTAANAKGFTILKRHV